MMDAMLGFPETAQFRSRYFPLVCLPLVCLSFAACRSAANSGPPPTPANAAAAAPDVRDGGLEVSTGFVTMNGATEVTCAFQQNENDEVQLHITVKSKCDTVGDYIDVTVSTPGAAVRRKMKKSFTANQPHTFPSFELSPPAPGTLVRTVVEVTCPGNTKDTGSGRCRVPRRD